MSKSIGTVPVAMFVGVPVEEASGKFHVLPAVHSHFAAPTVATGATGACSAATTATSAAQGAASPASATGSGRIRGTTTAASTALGAIASRAGAAGCTTRSTFWCATSARSPGADTATGRCGTGTEVAGIERHARATSASTVHAPTGNPGRTGHVAATRATAIFGRFSCATLQATRTLSSDTGCCTPWQPTGGIARRAISTRTGRTTATAARDEAGCTSAASATISDQV
ncbi:hypothetical protein ACHMW6_06695 [Pseudoduganella sp. UC29_106]|uniref:hypothetical protein n=1 Tax=Pseudoduganella sp. UC29_106 TaxID=3374553 RepID=UPI0037566014